MPRRNNSSAANEAAESPAVEVLPPAAPHMKQVVVNRRETYLEPTQAPAAEEEAPADDATDEHEEDEEGEGLEGGEFEEEELDPVTAFAERYRDAQGWRMQALRLPDPPGALYRVPCFEQTALPRLPWSPDTFVSEIQKHNRASGGYFKIQLLDNRGRFVPGASLTFPITDPPEAAPPPAAPAFAPATAPASGASDLDVALGALEKLDALAQRRRALMREAPQPAALPSADPPKSLRDQIAEAKEVAELLGLSRGDGERVTNGGGKSAGILGGLAELLDVIGTHAPKIVPVAMNYLQRAQAAAMMQQQNGGALPSHVPPPAAGVAAPDGNGAQQAPAAPTAQTEVPRVLAVVVNDLRRNKRVGRAAEEIEELLLTFPEVAEHFAPLLTMPAAEVLAQLSAFAGENLIGYAHAAEWVADLQDELRGGEEEGGEDDAAEAAK